jgi:PilZ domain
MELINVMDRRSGVRMRTDCPLTAYRDGTPLDCRAVDLSVGGALVRHPVARRAPLVQRFEIDLGRRGRVQTLARTVWSRGQWQAVRFIGLSDVERLDIAEHLDRLEKIARAA